MNIQTIADATFNLYRWYRRKRELKKETEEFNRIHYSCDNPKIGINEKTVVFMIDGKLHHRGWCDRLRGILTAYCICKEHGIPFRLYFKHPFDLETFLKPNLYDWAINSSDISYNADEAEAIVSFSKFLYNDDLIMKEYIEDTILKSTKKQIHVYSNIPYIFRIGYYSQAFNELFRLSDIVLKDVVHYKSLLAPRYISITTRFQNLLGDFDELGIVPLEENEQRKLIDKCIKQIDILHKEYPEYNVLVTSDSYNFLCEANKKTYVQIIDGKVVHMDWSSNKNLDVHKKSFVDFLCISGADHVFLLQSGQMYTSHFPYSAAHLCKRPYKMITF